MASLATIVGAVFLAAAALVTIVVLSFGFSDLANGLIQNLPAGITLTVIGIFFLIAIGVVLVGGKLKGGYGKPWAGAQGHGSEGGGSADDRGSEKDQVRDVGPIIPPSRRERSGRAFKHSQID